MPHYIRNVDMINENQVIVNLAHELLDLARECEGIVIEYYGTWEGKKLSDQTMAKLEKETSYVAIASYDQLRQRAENF